MERLIQLPGATGWKRTARAGVCLALREHREVVSRDTKYRSGFFERVQFIFTASRMRRDLFGELRERLFAGSLYFLVIGSVRYRVVLRVECIVKRLAFAFKQQLSWNLYSPFELYRSYTIFLARSSFDGKYC